MELLFKDLLIHEIVLLGLGVLLFFVLIITFIIYVYKNGPVKKLLLFFPFPIIMIAYPSIQGIEIAENKIKIVKTQEDMMKNPSDSIAIKKTIKYSNHIESRANSIEDFTTISKSNLLLGNSKKAIIFAKKALEEDKNNQIALDLKKLAEYNQSVQKKDSSDLKITKAPNVSPELNSIKKYLKKKHLVTINKVKNENDSL